MNSLLLAQDKHVTKGNQQWIQYYNQTKLSERWSVLVDGGYRWKDDLASRSQYIVRAGAGYRVNPYIGIAAGFAHLGTYTDLDITAVEFRPYQEISIENPGRLAINHRLRVEERFIEATDNSDQQFSRFNWRFRYFIGLSIPLVKFPNHQQRTIKFNIGDEIFINAGKDIVYNIFDQNRILIGPEFQLNESLTFTFTYHGNFAALNLPSEYIYNHILWLGIRHKMDLTKTGEK